MFYRRNLPHIQQATSSLFITFNTKNDFLLPDSAKDLVLEHCRFDDGKRYDLYGAVVMSNHVHLLLKPKLRSPVEAFQLREITGGIKGASAHSINKRLGRKGSVWQDESFDHLVRSNDDFEDCWMYILGNPVAAGLVRIPYDYKWLYVRSFGTAEGDCATVEGDQ